MPEVDHHDRITDGLALLIEGLQPFIESVFSELLPEGVAWTSILQRKDKLAGKRDYVYSPRDLSLMLRALTERLGELNYPFDRRLSRQGQNYASELRQVRNDWAHNQQFLAPAAYRALDSAELLLREIGATPQADRVAELKSGLLGPVSLAGPAAVPVADADPAASADETDAAPAPSDEIRVETAPQPKTAPSARIELQSLEFLSYAMAHCRIAVIDEVVVENLGAEQRAASLELDVVGPDGSYGDPKVHLLDLDESAATRLRDVELRLDPARMLTVDTQRPGEIRATLRDAAGEVLATAATPVQILAANQWIANPVGLGLEMLAAHVQPNAPQLGGVLREASDLLRAATGRSDLDGYQSDNPERVDAIVEAIYDAIRARDIRYAEPPASWGLNGQKVRNPVEVLGDRLGTCLDTTLTLAAALEQAGINSTLWLLEGHIFLGYWRIDSSLDGVATTEAIDVVNLVDLGLLALVETTMLTGGTDSRPFSEARRAPHTRHLAGSVDRVLGVADVRQARESRIHPLPIRTIGPDGELTVSIYEAGAGPVIAPYVGAPKAEQTSTDSAPPRVRQWKNALLDLSLRNKLINYTPSAGYRLEVPQTAVSRFEDAVNAGVSITLLASDNVQQIDQARGIRFGRDLPEDARELLLADKRSAYVDITQAAYAGKLRYLAYKAKTIVEETGANNLYLAFGMLHWRVKDRELRSPLVLVPVTMSTANRGERYRLSLDDAGMSTPNYCLLEKLRVEFGLEIPGLANPVEDASGIDLGAAFAAVRTAVLKAGLPFRVEESVDLSILQFAKFRLWKDLDENWQTLAKSPLVAHLIDSPTEAFVDPVPATDDVDLDELGAAVPVPADSSQLEAVADAVAGRTFVLEGPPGTGKSQTITNLLARALAAGRKVLFVAEKRAALDVVKQRLESVGLGDFSLDLHDKGARPAAVREQIRAALELRPLVDDDALRTAGETVVSSRRTLARYADRLHETNSAGYSLYSARTALLAADPDISTLEVPPTLVAEAGPETFAALRDLFRKLPELSDDARPGPDHPWGFVDERPTQPIEVERVFEAAQAFDAALARATDAGYTTEAIVRAASPDALDSWARLADAPRFPLASIDALRSPAWTEYLTALRQRIVNFAAATPAWMTTVAPTAVDLDTAAIHAAAVAADESGFFGRKKRRRAVVAMLGPALLVDGAQVPLKTLSQLTASLAASANTVAELREAVRRIPVQIIDDGWNPLVAEHPAIVTTALDWLQWLGAELAADRPYRDDMRAQYERTPSGSGAPLLEFAASWRTLFERLDIDAVTAWAGTRHFITKWTATRGARRLDAPTPLQLDTWMALVRHVEPLRTHGLTTVRRAVLVGRLPVEDAALAFDKGVAHASVTERERAHGLDEFDLAAHGRAIDRFTSSTRRVRSELPNAIPAQVLAHRRFAATSESGRVGELRRQLNLKRGVSVRRLLDQFSDLITDIMPCTLMSPESVARFFPAQDGLFDVVVFDEASQIRVADAVGAMGRANSVVVVGDSKQMPPTNFAESGSSVDEDEDLLPEAVPDEESILSECVQARVPSKWLSWHYRSQDESLIAFSNRHYYENRLSSFPAPLAQIARDTADGHGISLVRVAGHFERSKRGSTLRTNRVEADAIVEDVRRRFAASPDVSPSVGVITFNAPQRDLVENLLRDSGDDRIVQALDEVDGLFVKNLENVQGDERDTILFSVAFSANDRGVLPLNFGPLSRPGGERRLNVAVTRARRQVVLYASFDPAELRAEQTSQVGTKHLKAYLELAARGVEAVSNDGRRQAYGDRHRDEIAMELRQAGFAVQTDVGLSDFRIDLSIADAADPEHPLLAVLLDGPNWRARRTVADRDGLPVEVLSGLLRWPGVERVWLPEWLHARDETLKRITAAVDAARVAREQQSNADLAAASVTAQAPSAFDGSPDDRAEPTAVRLATSTTAADLVTQPPVATSIRAAAPAPTRVDLDVYAQHPDVVEFAEWAPGVLGTVEVLDGLPRARSTQSVAYAARRAVEAEGPMHSARLAKLVAGGFGLDRVAQARAAAILKAVPSELRPRGDREFIWPAGIDPSEWRLVRRSPKGAERKVEHVPIVEIANAMRVAAQVNGGMSEDELLREALALFGGARRTAAIKSRLDDALRYALDTGRLEESPTGALVAGRR